jgi:hypothetical protein
MSLSKDFGLPRRRAIRTALGGAVILSGFGPSRGQAAAPAGKVEALRGEASAQFATRKRMLAQEADLFVGDLVATAADSAVAFRLGVATHVRLGPQAELRIDRFLVNAGIVLELARGAMVFDRPESAPKTDTTVRSPYGLIAVRGTRFFAGPSNGVFGVFVERGQVAVVGANTVVELVAGFGTDIAAPGGEPTDPHSWGAARIQKAFADVQ